MLKRFYKKKWGTTSIYQKENDRLKVYNTTGENDSDTNHIVFLMDIDGYFVRAGY